MFVQDLKVGQKFTRTDTFDSVYTVEAPVRVGGGYAEVRYSVRGFHSVMMLRPLSTCTLVS